MNNLLLKLLEEKEDLKIFSLITKTKKGDCVLWGDIIETFHHFLPHKNIDKKYFWGKDLNILNRFGFDIDHEDSFGNTLLFHLFSKQNNNKYLSFEIKDILQKTQKLYHINSNNENILFHMANNLNSVAWEDPQDFISGKNLIDFIEKNPKLNIHQFNKLNRNLINQLLLGNSFPIQLFDYLVDKNVSINHIDKDGYNLINFFPLIYFNQNVAERFLMLCQHNEITHENKYKDSCISSLISFLSPKNSNTNEESHIKWLSFIFENIIEGKIVVNDKEKLISLLDSIDVKNDYSFEAKKLIPLQEKTIGFLKYQILNDKFPSKNIHNKKIKI